MTTNDQPLPTHRCTECGALWRLWLDKETGHGDSWNLRSPKAGPCCDMAPMGEQIVPLTWGDLRTALAGPVDPNHDIVPTLRQFDGLLMGKAADEIERLRTALALAAAPAAAQAQPEFEPGALGNCSTCHYGQIVEPPAFCASCDRTQPRYSNYEPARFDAAPATAGGAAGATGEQP
jgi:cytochrome c553